MAKVHLRRESDSEQVTDNIILFIYKNNSIYLLDLLGIVLFYLFIFAIRDLRSKLITKILRTNLENPKKKTYTFLC